MYVETRTDASEVLETVLRELIHMIIRLRNTVHTKRNISSYVTNPQLRQMANELRGAYVLACRVAGDPDRIPLEVHEQYGEAVRAAQELVGKLA